MKFSGTSQSSQAIDSKSSELTAKKTRSLKHLKSRRKMSCLEKLPVELLTRVFLFSLNFELPRSSPIIGGKLSSDHVYVRTIIAAFHNSWFCDYAKIMNVEVPNCSPVSPRKLDSHVLQVCNFSNPEISILICSTVICSAMSLGFGSSTKESRRQMATRHG